MTNTDTPARPAITFEEMPQAVSAILDRLDGLNPKPTEKEWMSIDELCEYLPERPAKATVYGWVWAKTIPYSKFSKKLSFNRQKIDEWHRRRLCQLKENVA